MYRLAESRGRVSGWLCLNLLCVPQVVASVGSSDSFLKERIRVALYDKGCQGVERLSIARETRRSAPKKTRVAEPEECSAIKERTAQPEKGETRFSPKMVGEKDRDGESA